MNQRLLELCRVYKKKAKCRERPVSSLLGKRADEFLATSGGPLPRLKQIEEQ